MELSEPESKRISNRWLRSPVVGLLLLPCLAAADPCYRGDASTGTLEFDGAVEGSGFTGRFGEFDVQYCMPEAQPAGGRIDVTVNLTSADSGNRDRDETLLGPEFFDVERFPRATWTSTAIQSQGHGYRAQGDLTLRDITADQPITFTLTPDGEKLVAEGRFSLSGSAEVDRQRYEVGTGEFADPDFVRNRVDVRFEVELTKEP